VAHGQPFVERRNYVSAEVGSWRSRLMSGALAVYAIGLLEGRRQPREASSAG